MSQEGSQGRELANDEGLKPHARGAAVSWGAAQLVPLSTVRAAPCPKRLLCVVASLLHVWPAWAVAVRCTGSELPDTWETWHGRARCPLSLVPVLLPSLDSCAGHAFGSCPVCGCCSFLTFCRCPRFCWCCHRVKVSGLMRRARFLAIARASSPAVGRFSRIREISVKRKRPLHPKLGVSRLDPNDNGRARCPGGSRAKSSANRKNCSRTDKAGGEV